MDVPLYTVFLIAATVLIATSSVLARSRFKDTAAGRSMPLVMALGAVLLTVGSWLSHDLTVWSMIIIALGITLAILNISTWIRQTRLRNLAGRD
ncbi:hypothetical protein [Prescottella equi]|uniref:hypothetical protein n=1 Tax=Rhodococcus hoagii TaxID=43767 RepID=UPI00301D3163